MHSIKFYLNTLDKKLLDKMIRNGYASSRADAIKLSLLHVGVDLGVITTKEFLEETDKIIPKIPSNQSSLL